MKQISFFALFAFAVLTFLSGCLPQLKPIVARPELYTVHKPVIHIMPLVDVRPDTSDSGNFNHWARKTLSWRLGQKGYKTVIVKDRAGVKALEEDQLRGMRDTITTAEERELIAHLGPDDAEWILLPILQDYRLKMVLGCKGTSDVGGYLLEKKTGRTILWHKAEGVGTAGPVLCGQAGRDAIGTAFFDICRAFPKNPKAKK